MKKIFLCFLFYVLVNILIINDISASNTISVTYPPNVYYTIDVPFYGYHHTDYQPFIRIDGKLLYCIEPEKLIGFDVPYDITSFDNMNLSDKVKNYIELVGYFGYDYPNHQNYKYYLAAQELIWHKVRNMTVIWHSDINDPSKIIDVDNEKREIMSLITKYSKTMYLDTYTLSINSNITLSDALMSEFEIIDSLNLNSRIDGNNLIINTTDFIGTSKVVLAKKLNRYDDEKTIVYTSPSLQTLIFPRVTNILRKEITINTVAGKISVQKLDAKTLKSDIDGYYSLKGATYNIYDTYDNLISTLVLDGDVKTTDYLPLGIYTIREVYGGKGYAISKGAQMTNLTRSNLSPLITFMGKSILKKFTIKKLYGDITYQVESNAVFEITDEEGNKKEYVTNEDGLINLELSYGKYKVHQVSGINNYKLVEDFELVVDENIKDIELKNEILKGSLTISCLSNDTNNLLKEEVLFKIFDVANNKYLIINDKDIFKTINGIIEIKNINYGDYILEEVTHPLGYNKVNKLEFKIDKDVQLSIKYSLIKNIFKITKIGEDNVLLNNVIFEMYAKEDNAVYLKDELVSILTTNNGIANVTLPLGLYYIKEVKTNEGYILDDTIYTIDLTNDASLKIKNYMEETLQIPVPNTGVKEIKVIDLVKIIVLLLNCLLIRYVK